MQFTRFRRVGVALSAAALALLLVSGVADAHVVKTFGTYSVALGWVHEPTYVGEQNAVQVVIKDASGKAVTDLNDGDLKVTVSVGGQTSDPLPLLNKFDPDTGLGVPGDYEAPVIPTAPGDYTFHLTGSIHSTAVDETAVSSDSTFNSVVGATGIQFPNQLPALTDVVTRLDRIDARLASQAPVASSAPAAAPAPASSATDTTALLAGAGIGTLGLLVALVALGLAIRGRRAAG